MNNKVAQLAQYIQNEINLVATMNGLLQEEKETLIKREFDLLQELSNKKQELSLQLEENAKLRMNLLGYNTSNVPNQVLNEFLKDCPDSEVSRIHELNNKLLDQLALCRELNAVNGQVITANISIRQQIIDALSGKLPGDDHVYTATGVVKNTSGATHYEKA